MAYPISAYFGRDTHALFGCCAYCNKPYNEAERWHTLQTSIEQLDLWWLACDECYCETARELRGDAKNE